MIKVSTFMILFNDGFTLAKVETTRISACS